MALVPIEELGRWRVCPRIDGATGVWWHGTKVRTFYGTKFYAERVAERFSRVFRVQVQLYGDHVTTSGAVAALPDVFVGTFGE